MARPCSNTPADSALKASSQSGSTRRTGADRQRFGSNRKPVERGGTARRRRRLEFVISPMPQHRLQPRLGWRPVGAPGAPSPLIARMNLRPGERGVSPPATRAHWAAGANTTLSEIDADGDVAAHQLGNGSRICQQLREFRVLRHCLLHLAIHFPTGVARNDQPLSGPHAGVEPGQPKKFGTMFFEDCLRLLLIAVRSRSAANHWEGPKKRPQRGLRTEAVLFPLSLEAVGRLRLPSLSDHISPTGAVRFYT